MNVAMKGVNNSVVKMQLPAFTLSHKNNCLAYLINMLLKENMKMESFLKERSNSESPK